jgi:hypothetical protein
MLMTPKQLRDTESHYWSMFGDDLSPETKETLEGIDTIYELDEIADELSAGEFDCAEAILEDR